MRPIRAWLIYVFLVFFGAALVAPWLYWAAQSLAMHFRGLQHLAESPFHRFVNRSLLMLALAGLWPLLRKLGVRSWASVGLPHPRGHWRSLGTGFAWGFATLALVAAIASLSGARSWNSNLTPLVFIKGLSGALVSAAVVALMEELLFRGAVLGSLRQFHPWALALLISSGFYALVHFFQHPQSPNQITWLSGFVTLGRMMAGLVDVQLLIPGFLALLLAGGILGMAFLRTGTLYESIGLHAGWIFWLKLYGLIDLETSTSREHHSIWGTGKLFDGWLAFMILLPVFLIFWRNYTRLNERRLDTRSEKLA
jgi:membrane protease YdiL (CAAX protease family)